MHAVRLLFRAPRARLVPRPLARSFAIYSTPACNEPIEWEVKHKVQVAPEYSGLLAAFEKLRSEGQDASLTREDFAEVMNTTGTHIESKHIETLFDMFDVYPRDGKVSYTEVGTYLLLNATNESMTLDEKMEFVFPICDLNGDNHVSKEELSAIVETLVFTRKKDRNEAKTMAKRVVSDAFSSLGKDELNIHDFVAWLRSEDEYPNFFKGLFSQAL